MCKNMSEYTGDQRTWGPVLGADCTLMEYTDHKLIPAVVMKQLVSQVNQAVAAPVEELFFRATHRLVARVTGRVGGRGSGRLEGRLMSVPAVRPAPCTINDLPLLFRIVGFKKGHRFKVHSAGDLGTLWADVRVSAKDGQGNALHWPAPVRVSVHPKTMVARGALQDALAVVAAGEELDPGLCMLRPDWELSLDVDVSALPAELCADSHVLIPPGHRVTARRAYACLWCQAFGGHSWLKRCSRCKEAHYCDKACQKRHWLYRHKQECPAMRAWRARAGN